MAKSIFNGESESPLWSVEVTPRDERDEELVLGLQIELSYFKDRDIDWLWDNIYTPSLVYNPMMRANYIWGKGGHHIWVSRKSDNERVLMIAEKQERI